MPNLLTSFFVLALAFAAACGSNSSSGVPPKCSGSTCTCPAGSACEIGSGTCENSCSLDCSNMNDCMGECGSSCSLKCTGTSACTMTVGPSASVDCSGGATCHITCTGSCSVDCGGGSTCDLTCPGDSGPKTIGAQGSCG